MRNITYKYNIGDIVELKPENSFDMEFCGSHIRVTSVRIVERRYYDCPCYRFEGFDGFWEENCILGLREGTKNDLYDEETEGQDNLPTKEKDASGNENRAIWHYSKVDPVFICSNCQCSALNDYRGRSTASKYCPHCGEYMTNHQQEDDDDV